MTLLPSVCGLVPPPSVYPSIFVLPCFLLHLHFYISSISYPNNDMGYICYIHGTYMGYMGYPKTDVKRKPDEWRLKEKNAGVSYAFTKIRKGGINQ